MSIIDIVKKNREEFDELNIFELLNARPEEYHLYQRTRPKILSFLLSSQLLLLEALKEKCE